MDATQAGLLWGGIFIAYGLLSILFAFVAKENGIVNVLFRIPAIYIFLPANSRVMIGRVLTGIMSIALGAFLIYQMLRIPSI